MNRNLGGTGSGNFGHGGRPGEVGGSAPASGVLDAIRQADGGFTYHAVTGTQPSKGFALSLHKDRERILRADDVNLMELVKYAKDNGDLLQRSNNYFGGWHNPADGKVYLDVSTVVDSPEEAERLGQEADQLAYFDLEHGKSIEIERKKRAASITAFNWSYGWHANSRRPDRARSQLDGPRTHERANRRSPQNLRRGITTLADRSITFQFDKADPHAVDWADRHAAELVTNISETTREAINNAIAEALEHGDIDSAYEDILAAVGDKVRAEFIARTETMMAASEGQRQAWDQAVDKGLLTGDEKRQWIAVGDDKMCPICEFLDGQVTDLEGKYVDADGNEYDGPIAHPACRCTEGLV